MAHLFLNERQEGRMKELQEESLEELLYESLKEFLEEFLQELLEQSTKKLAGESLNELKQFEKLLEDCIARGTPGKIPRTTEEIRQSM